MKYGFCLLVVFVALSTGRSQEPELLPAVASDSGSPAIPSGVRAEDKKPDPLSLNGKWKNGPVFTSDDGLFTFQPVGRFQFDSVLYAAPTGIRQNLPGVMPFEDGVAVRRSRLGVDGAYNKTIEFKVEYDFANAFVVNPSPLRTESVTVPTELNVTFREVPYLGNVRIGNQKQPISFEHTTSSKYLNFLERSPAFDAFTENGNNGFSMGGTTFQNFLADKRGYYSIGLFKNTRSIFGYNVGRNELDVTGRLVLLPVYENQGEQLLHVGVAASHRDLDDDQTRYRTRFGVRSAPSALASLIQDTGVIFGSRQQTLVPEVAGVVGPFSFQSEYYLSWLSQTELPVGTARVPFGGTFYHGGYVEVHYFLTGEHRSYDHERMAFTRVTPKRPLSWTGEKRGFGAWQLALRYSYLDLTSKGIQGGVTHEFVAGVNWFMTANLKMQANYVLTDRTVTGSAANGLLHGFGVRTAWDF